MTVVVAGEALVDLILSPSGAVAALAGGGPFNSARTLARLGVDTVFLGGLADDRFGRLLRARLAEDGVRLGLPRGVGLPTSLAVAELDESGTQALHVGTLGLVLEPLAESVEAIVAAADADAVVLVDPNCRPGIIRDEGAYRARLGRVLARADVVKVSGDDLDYLDPTVTPLDAARALLHQGPRVVLFTDGADSVRILTHAEEITVPVPPVDVVDTVGAGDAFGGAFLAFWVTRNLGRGELVDLATVRTVVERAVVVAGITCTRAGANPPRLDELPG
jgi:fructokinase